MTWRPDLFNDSMAATGIETGTKLYISNLDYGVSNEDIKELFSEFGHLKRFAVHYDGYGRPNGTAEVVFTRRSDAIASLKRYNNVLLDGKAMKIEVIGSDLGLPMTPRINVVGASNGRATRTTVVMMPEFGQRGRGSSSRPLSNPGNRWNRGAFQSGRGRGWGSAPFQARGRGRGQFQARGRGRGQFQARGRGRGRGRKPEKTADELDKDLETYHVEAMKTD
ncbi:THO complex subunit 4D-like isoform X2 [Phragmites australis]|nr:THO complex subunit 4D-like isoform X2 [Phragmites australis]